MDKIEIIRQTELFVQKVLENAESGHDWFHIDRVRKNAKYIAQNETADLFILELGALLHDIADAKFYDGNETVGPRKAQNFLEGLDVSDDVIEQVVKIIENISFKNTLSDRHSRFDSIELRILQDADRLDAIGAIGIARAFNYGGFKNRQMYHPEIPPKLDMTKEEYKKSEAPTINHFYEKLLLLKDQMNTETGKKLAEERHQFMLTFLDQFYAEWNAKKA
ncbi:HD domain-containing protein [Namhaeicola litoreus]|uniref:HD domain-containing protein n=1 Tax=Namhaeicola litoreus TaxID=1052145 RepID=A0ABW3XZP2_9FLAO